MPRVLATRKKYVVSTKKWTAAEVICTEESPAPELQIKLKRGGTISLFPNHVKPKELSSVREEVLNCNFFRQYPIQAQDEPRCHFILHEDATDDFDKGQPGYKYANIEMKARPLRKLPFLEELSKVLAISCNVEKWTIGINPVLYRDGKDRMGDHADNDQGEQLILALIVAMPEKEDRKIEVRPFQVVEFEDGDELITLTLKTGDMYSMDGEMQKHYTHAIPASSKRKKIATYEGTSTLDKQILAGHGFGGDKQEVVDTERRLVIVFRTGKRMMFAKDSGDAVANLRPRQDSNYHFGGLPNLIEGGIYSRTGLRKMGAHLMQQRGISGNRAVGCDAIIVSGLREDGEGWDEFIDLMYAAESAKGALSVVKSHDAKHPVRIFRSSTYQSCFGARKGATTNCYRYDGLYRVIDYDKPSKPGGPFRFYFRRMEERNKIPNGEFFNHCKDKELFRTYESEGEKPIEYYLSKHANPRLIRELKKLATTFYNPEEILSKRRRRDG